MSREYNYPYKNEKRDTVNITVREYKSEDAHTTAEIWNEVVRDGVAFPQENEMSDSEADEFFRSQSYTGIACDENGKVYGLYILHPNNVGRCGHISNASYAVSSTARGKGVGRAVVTDCIRKAKELGFGVLQFNAVVASNAPALALYKSLGFTQLGVIPKGFRLKDGKYEDIIPHYIEL